MSDKLEKKDFHFLLAMLGFGLICFARFYNQNLMSHKYVLEIMNNMLFKQLITVVLVVLIVLFTGLVLAKSSGEMKHIVYYLATMLAVVTMPFYICDSYIGTSDIYTFAIMIACLFLLMWEKNEWVVILLVIAMTYISPAMTVTCGAVILAELIKAYAITNSKKYLRLIIGIVFTVLVSTVLAYITYRFSFDVQGRITTQRFIVILLLLSPYLYWGVGFLFSLISEAADNKRIKIAYVLSALGGLPTFVMWSYLHDYCRSILYTFVYYLLIVLMGLIVNDFNYDKCVRDCSSRIKTKIVIPSVVVIYLLIIVTFWMVSNDYIEAETFIELIQK